MPTSTSSEAIFIAVSVATGIFLFLGGLLVAFLIIQQRKKRSLYAQYQQEILQTQLEIQNQTLQHISGELHDNIGQLLSVARLQLNILETEESPKTEQIVEVNGVIEKTIHELRALSKSLDGDFVNNFGLVESLSHELQRIRNTRKYQTEIIVEGEGYRLEGQKEIVLFRVVQEILNNILKHAAAKSIVIELQYTPDLFTIMVQDDGKGFDYEEVMQHSMSESGAGLRNIKRRTELIGGQCTFESTPNSGTKIKIQLKNSPIGV